MLTRFEQKKQALEKLEEALTQLWNVYLFLYSHREGSKILEAWNLAFDVKEELRIELEERRNKKMEIKNIYDELVELEDRIWKAERQLNEGYLKDRFFDIRCKLIKNLLKIRELL